MNESHAGKPFFKVRHGLVVMLEKRCHVRVGIDVEVAEFDEGHVGLFANAVVDPFPELIDFADGIKILSDSRVAYASRRDFPGGFHGHRLIFSRES